MATKKATSAAKKRTTAKRPVAKKATTTTRVRTVASEKTTAPVAKVATATATVREGVEVTKSPNMLSIVIAEIIGTFILVMVALLTAQDIVPLFVGLTLVVLVLALGAISGSHVNPAVTFGLWSIRRLKTVLVPVYWAAQFIGAMGAVVLLNAVTAGGFTLDFSKFASINWGILVVELIGTAVFLFGLAAATSKDNNLSNGSRAIGVGLSLMVGLLVATSLFGRVQSAVDQTKIKSISDVPAELRVKGAALNPAVAVAATENTDSELSRLPAAKDEKQYSRFTLDVILGTLAGAAIGANLYVLLARSRNA